MWPSSVFVDRLAIPVIALVLGLAWSIAIRPEDRGWQRLGSRFMRAGGALVATMTMATMVDEGVTRAWSEPARWLWVFAMIQLAVLGVTSGVEALSHDPPPFWKKYVPAMHIGAASFSVLFGLGLLAESRYGIDPLRVCFVGMGLVLTWTWGRRHVWFWEHPKTLLLRELLGDRATYFLCLALGVIMTFIALWP